MAVHMAGDGAAAGTSSMFAAGVSEDRHVVGCGKDLLHAQRAGNKAKARRGHRRAPWSAAGPTSVDALPPEYNPLQHHVCGRTSIQRPATAPGEQHVERILVQPAAAAELPEAAPHTEQDDQVGFFRTLRAVLACTQPADRGGGELTSLVACPVPSPLLSIVPVALEISRVLPTADDVTIEAGLARKPVNCPACGHLSRRLHSRYPRVLRDLPWQGRPATIRVTARRFCCLNGACARKTFAEHLGSVATASARRTTRLGDLQRHVAFALGGEAAARLAERLAIPASPDTLLRMASRPVVADAPPPTTKVLGVDDWAWRRGCQRASKSPRLLECAPAGGQVEAI